MNWQEKYKNKKGSIEECASIVKSGMNVAAGPASSFPLELMNAVTRREDIEHINIFSGLLVTLPDFLNPDQKDKVTFYPLFMGPVERAMLDMGILSPVSVHFSRMGEFFKNQDIDVTILEVSPPDDFGFMCIGTSAPMIGKSRIEHTKKVIVQINPNVPFINGSDIYVHMDEVDMFCEVDRPLFELPDMPPDEDEIKIAEYIVPMIPDRSTLQLGIGNLANAIGDFLIDKKDLGVHTEIITPSMVNLYKKGVITGKYKDIHRDKIVASFILAKKEDYEFVHRNPIVELHPTYYVNDPYNIAKHKNLISINNALNIDLTGQVASEAIGYKQFSGTGGQLDFVRGARMSEGGKSFIALKSTGKKGTASRIKLSLDPGTAVTTPRSDVQYIVTEYGVARLDDKTLPGRAVEMINIAHPKFREELAKEALENKLIPKSMKKEIKY